MGFAFPFLTPEAVKFSNEHIKAKRDEYRDYGFILSV